MRLPPLPLWLPLSLAAVYFFAGLGTFGLLDNNEGLYSAIGLEMARGGSWTLPHVIGLPYLEKPPLLYYIVATSLGLFGATEWAARLPPALAALACLMGTAVFAHKLRFGNAGRLAMLILASSLGYIIMARLVMFDMLLTACLNLALFGFWLAWRGAGKIWLRAGYGLLALAILAKGLVALVLAGLVIGVYFLLWQRRRLLELLVFLADLPGLGLFLLVVIPWHVLASLDSNQFAHFYFINEHVLRFLGQRIPHDYYSGPLYYYVPRLALFLLPWTLFAFFRPRRGDFRSEGNSEDRESRRFLWAAWLVPLIFFSLSSAKANYYLVVVMPPLALLLALHIEALLTNRCQGLLCPILVLVAGLTLGFVAWGIKSQGDFGLTGAPDAALRVACGIGLLLTALAALLLAWRDRPLGALVAVALLPLAPGAYALHVAPQHESRFSARPLAQALDQHCPDCQVFLYKDFEAISSLAFYLKHPPNLVDSVSNDLYFAQHSGAAPDRFISAADLAALPNNKDMAIVVLDDRLAEFRANPLAARFQFALRSGRANLFVWHNPTNQS